MYVLDGAHELAGRRDLAHEWFEGLTAPHKELITYGDAGHSVVFEEADAWPAARQRRRVGQALVALACGTPRISDTPTPTQDSK